HLQQGGDQVGAVAEILVHGAEAHARGVGHVADARGLVAVLGKQTGGGVEDGGTRALGLRPERQLAVALTADGALFEGVGDRQRCSPRGHRPAPRNTDRRRSSRPRISAAEPEKRTWPFSMNSTRRAASMARVACCSTARMVTPSPLRRAGTPISSSTMTGARPTEGSWTIAI